MAPGQVQCWVHTSRLPPAVYKAREAEQEELVLLPWLPCRVVLGSVCHSLGELCVAVCSLVWVVPFLHLFGMIAPWSGQHLSSAALLCWLLLSAHRAGSCARFW